MKSVRSRFAGEHGITLLELIITALIATIVISAVTQFYISQHYHVNQQIDVAEIQQSLRAAMQEMTDQLRMAGYGLPSSMDPIVATNSNPDSIQFYYRKSPTSQAELQTDMANVKDVLDCSGYDLSEFESGTWAYIHDPSSNTGEFFYMSNVDQGGPSIHHPTSALSKLYPKGSQIIAVEIYRYYLDQSDTSNPVLVRSRQGEGAVTYAEGIDSLQFRYLLTNNTWTDAPAAGRLVRAVQITMTARGRDDSEGVVGGVRERRLSNRVNIRNLAL